MIALSPSLAFAQSSTATTGITKPTTTVPASNATIGQPKSNIPPAARSGEKGIRAGEGAMDAGPVEVKRLMTWTEKGRPRGRPFHLVG